MIEEDSRKNLRKEKRFYDTLYVEKIEKQTRCINTIHKKGYYIKLQFQQNALQKFNLLEEGKTYIFKNCKKEKLASYDHELFFIDYKLIIDQYSEIKYQADGLLKSVNQNKRHYESLNLFFPNVFSEIQLFSYIDECKDTLLICMFTIDCIELIDRIKKLKLKTCVIIYDKNQRRKQRKMNEFVNQMLQVQNVELYEYSKEQNHCKFIIIDNKYLISGSLNLTTQGLTKNQEHVSISNSKKDITDFSYRFSYLKGQSKQTQEIIMKIQPNEQQKKINFQSQPQQHSQPLYNQVIGTELKRDNQISIIINTSQEEIPKNQNPINFNKNKENNYIIQDDSDENSQILSDSQSIKSQYSKNKKIPHRKYLISSDEESKIDECVFGRQSVDKNSVISGNQCEFDLDLIQKRRKII